MNGKKHLLCVSALLAFSASFGWAQGTVTMFGLVTDATGAVVPEVEVTVSNLETGATRRSRSDATGNYVVPLLPVGVYALEARGPGFKEFVQTDIRVQVNENRRIDIRMEVGEVTENITVQAEIAQVETRTGTLREVVDSRRIVELPLNGRNPVQLQYLVAGVGRRPFRGQAQNQGVAINGSRTQGNNYELDGGDNQDPFFNTPSVFPSPDALQEFSIQTSSYSADKGRNAGALMTAVTKSGTNEVHGTLFEFLRNDKLNTRNFFANDVPPFKRNQYGGTVGGPIVRDRTFFFASYQGTRERSAPGSISSNVHTPAMRKGDFSELTKPLKDPQGGTFPNNIIPASRLYEPSLKFLDAFVPLPNRADGLLSFASGQSIDDEQLIGKVDHQLGENNRLATRLLYNFNDLKQAVATVPGFLASIKYTNWNLVVNDTHVISPTIVNNFVFTWQNINREQLSITPNDLTWIDFGAGIKRTFTEDKPAAHDTRLDGYWRAFTRFPLDQVRNWFQFSEAMSISRGAHLIKFGGEVRYSATERFEFFLGDPRVRFRNKFTGDAAADFMLGRPEQMRQLSPFKIKPEGYEYTAYVQDDWKVLRRLTFNLGLRWDPFTPLPEAQGGRAHFRLGQQSKFFPTAPAGLVYQEDAGIPKATMPNRWANFAPRFGFAFDPFGTGRTSVRGGYGVFFGVVRLQGFAGRGPGFNQDLTIDSPPGGLADPYRETGFPFPFSPPETADERAAFEFEKPISFNTFDADYRNPIVQQWNFNIQKQFLRSYVFTAAYVGTKGNHLFMNNELNPAIFGLPGGLNQRRPLYPDFSRITNRTSVGNSTYHSMQLTLNKRMADGFTILTNYTFSKLLDDSSAAGDRAANPFNIANEKGHSDNDITHRFVASYIWELPRLTQAGPFLRHLFGGWETNGIVTLESGSYFNVVSGRNNSGSGVNQDRPDLVGDPSLDTDRPRGELIQRYFNPGAFAQNAPGTFGTAGRNLLQGPGFATVDFGLFKNIYVTEGHRIQFRTEVFNLFNRVNLNNPNGNIAARNVGRITSAGDPRVIQFALKYVF